MAALQFVYSDFMENPEIHREMVEWLNFQNGFAGAVWAVGENLGYLDS